MKKLLVPIILIAAIVGFYFSAEVPNAADSGAKVGEAAPNFTLNDVSLESFKGKVVVLEWFNKGCPYVRKFYNVGHMQKLQAEYAAKDVVWLSIISSAKNKQGYITEDEIAEVTASRQMASTHVLLDVEGNVGRLYGAKTTPHMYVINQEGVLAYSGAIDSVPSARSSDIEKAENYVVSAVDALLENAPVATSVTKPYGCSVKY